MQAVVIHETGGPEVLQLEQVDRPEPGDGEVLIKIHAASVNPIDWKYRRGLAPKQLPAVLGHDVSGTIELSRAEGFAEGEGVFGSIASGGYAEFATAPAAVIAKKPSGVSHEQAAAIPVSGCRHSRRTRSLVPSIRRSLMAPAWDCPSAAPSLNHIAAASGLPTTLRAAQVFTSFYRPKSRHMRLWVLPRPKCIAGSNRETGR